KQTIKKWCHMTNENSADQPLRSAAHNVVEDVLRRAKAVPHAGERGTAREDVVRSCLGDFLPKRCGVGTGFVMDTKRAVSKQIDVVLYDRLVGTMLTIREGTGLFPVETVCGVGEVKSDLSTES
ncbi:MAG TPA: DUF6602 domain-containing protein, partial [Nitrospiraceae bacterium]|nr:DUF6602 domain-containing protein [Nitrospiraceae bacterium]